MREILWALLTEQPEAGAGTWMQQHFGALGGIAVVDPWTAPADR